MFWQFHIGNPYIRIPKILYRESLYKVSRNILGKQARQVAKPENKCTSNGYCKDIECKQKDNEEETEVCKAIHPCRTTSSGKGWNS